MPGALSRFRMPDLSRQLPGPFCSMLLADLGMDVLAVYSPTDPMGMGIPLLGRNKRSLTLNLKAPEGRAILHRLAREADVVLEGSRPGAAARLGVDYETLGQLNPRLVYCSISGYGQDGPYRDRVGHDVNYLGFAGVIGLTGTAGGPPVIPGVQIADIGGGTLMAAVGVLAALAAREETGRGQFVDIAMLDGSLAWQVVHVMRYLAERQEPARGDTMLTGHHPCYAIYETRDGRHVTVGALEPHFWRTLCQRLGMPEFIEKQFAEGAEREEMFRRIRARFREQTMAEWVAELARRGARRSAAAPPRHGGRAGRRAAHARQSDQALRHAAHHPHAAPGARRAHRHRVGRARLLARRHRGAPRARRRLTRRRIPPPCPASWPLPPTSRAIASRAS